eukprot:TRINITY_DN971_c0_g1_i12.p1 TRINITY_DN971_c0_g1~~TRINITY_DN971_c0_g1_i12.p1  ORF type:complete len:104 (-),score=6.97 TRINITY_DN971_c0_g1_i12:621-932(-)
MVLHSTSANLNRNANLSEDNFAMTYFHQEKNMNMKIHLYYQTIHCEAEQASPVNHFLDISGFFVHPELLRMCTAFFRHYGIEIDGSFIVIHFHALFFHLYRIT